MVGEKLCNQWIGQQSVPYPYHLKHFPGIFSHYYHQINYILYKTCFVFQLIGGLADEKERWKVSVEKLEYVINNYVGDVLVSSGYVAYLGTFTVSIYISHSTRKPTSIRNSQSMPRRLTPTDTFSLLWIFCFRNHYSIPLLS